MPRYGRVLATALILLLSTLAPAADRAVCRNDATVLKDLRADITRLEQLQHTLTQLAAGTLPADIALEDLLGSTLIGDNERGAPAPTRQWPDQLDCPGLQEDYQAELKDLRWLTRNLQTRRQQWLAMAPSLRRALHDLWQSRQNIQTAYDALDTALADAGYEVDLNTTPIGAVHAQQRILRLKILRLLPQLSSRLDENAVLELISLYQYAIDNPLVIGQFDATQIAELPDQVRDAGLEYLAVARLDALNLRYLINRVRSWAWRAANTAFIDIILDRSSLMQLLRMESHALEFRVFEFRHNIELELETRQRSDHPLTETLQLLVRYLSGGLALLLLAVIARRLSGPLLRLNDRVSRALKGRRSLASLNRFLHGLALLAPWLAGWIGLTLLTDAYLYYQVYFLIAAIPFARMYIFYGVGRLAGEWLLLRIAQQAGVYLSNDQASALQPGIRIAALIMVLPLLAMDLIATIIGPSLMLDVSLLVVVLSLYLACSVLLGNRRTDLLAAVQSVLPERMDPWAERLLAGPQFWLFAPAQLLILLPAFSASFFHRLLIDFDWYRKLTARWFKMRVSSRDDADADKDLRQVAENYSSWFADSHAERELPYIESGLFSAIRKPLDRWLEEKSDENALLLTGERGIGKSSALRKLEKTLAEKNPDLKVSYCQVPAKTCAPESVLSLVGRCLDTDLSNGAGMLVDSDDARQPTVVILDNAQNFFLSDVGRLNGWQTLLGLTNARVNNIYWIISINNQSWAYLSNVFGRDYQFNNVLRAKPWTQNDIRSLILSRNHLSSFKLQYDEVLLSTRGPEAGNIRNAEQRYFSLLWDACHGNPMLALRLWLTSVHAAGGVVTASLPEEPVLPNADKLSGKLLFVYAAIVIHENLTTEEIVAATSLPESVVRYALKAAFDAGFLQRSDDGRYRIVPLWYYTITNLLARKNLLHE